MRRGVRACLPAAAAVILAPVVVLLAVSLAPPAAADLPTTPGPDAAPPPAAAAPWCIAGVCLGAPEKEILQRFGAGRPFPDGAPVERCYQARGKSYYVTALLDKADPARRVTGILLSSETTCPAAGPARFAPDRAGCRGLMPFDSADKLPGLGATERSAHDKGHPWKGSPPDVTQFDYHCEPETECSIMASAFVRNRTVIAVAIWEPDC